MITLTYGKRFEKILKKYLAKHPGKRIKVKERLNLFSENPFTTELKSHKLSGELEGLWALSVDYDTRIIYENINENTVQLITIGSHDAVY